MNVSLNNKYLHLASAFISGLSVGYLICLNKRKCKPTGEQQSVPEFPILLSTKKCNESLCPIDMTAVFKKADEQQPDQPLN